MNYIDPYDFLGLQVNSPDEVDGPKLQRAKRRLLADLEFAADGILKWGDHEIGKSQALAFVDQMEDAALRRDYWWMRQSIGVKEFLQRQTFSASLKLELEQMRKQASLQALALPFLLPVFSAVLRKAAADQRLADFGKALSLINPFNLVDEDPLWQGTVQLFNGHIGGMQRALEQPEAYLADFPLATYGSTELCAMLNRLPAKYGMRRDEFAIALLRLITAHRRAGATIAVCKKAIKGLETLDLSREAQNTIMPELRALARLLDPYREQEPIAPPPVQEQAPPIANEGYTSGQKSLAVGIVVAFLFVLFLAYFARELNERLYDVGDNSHVTHAAPVDSAALKAQKHYSGGTERLYELLWTSHLGKKHAYGAPDTLENGEAVYAGFLTTHVYDGLNVFVENKSEAETVLFVEDGTGEKLIRAVYLAPHQPSVLVHLGSYRYYFRVYTGKNWVDSVAVVDGDPLPGFAEDVAFVGSTVDYNHPETPPEAELFVQMGQYSSSERRLIFDGKTLTWEE